jgi:hypothetical protein
MQKPRPGRTRPGLAFAGEIEIDKGLSRRQLTELQRLSHDGLLVVAEATSKTDCG